MLKSRVFTQFLYSAYACSKLYIYKQKYSQMNCKQHDKNNKDNYNINNITVHLMYALQTTTIYSRRLTFPSKQTSLSV